MSETIGALHRDDGLKISPDNTSSISDDTSTERIAYTPPHSPISPESLFPSWLNPAYFGHLRDARERKLEDLIKELIEFRSRMRALLYRAKEPADPSLLTSEWTWEDEVRELQERMSGLRNLIFELHTEIELSRQPPDATEAPHDAAIVKDISPKQNPSANGPPSQSVKSHTTTGISPSGSSSCNRNVTLNNYNFSNSPKPLPQRKAGPQNYKTSSRK